MQASDDADGRVEFYIEQALKAFAGATDLDKLKAARIHHLGDLSPLMLTMRGIGELPPERRSPVGWRLAQAYHQLYTAQQARARQLGAEACPHCGKLA